MWFLLLFFFRNTALLLWLSLRFSCELLLAYYFARSLKLLLLLLQPDCHRPQWEKNVFIFICRFPSSWLCPTGRVPHRTRITLLKYATLSFWFKCFAASPAPALAPALVCRIVTCMLSPPHSPRPFSSERDGMRGPVSRRQTVKIALLFRSASLFKAAFAWFYEKIVIFIVVVVAP